MKKLINELAKRKWIQDLDGSESPKVIAVAIVMDGVMRAVDNWGLDSIGVKVPEEKEEAIGKEVDIIVQRLVKYLRLV